MPWIFLLGTGFKVSIYKTLEPVFDIIEVSKTGGDYFYDDTRKRKS